MNHQAPSPETLNAVIVGCGGFAANYLNVYSQSKSVKPVLCYDICESAASSRADAYGGVPYTTDFDDVLSAEADLAVVSSPNFLHLEHAGKLLQSGKHVLVQKPLARTLDEAKALFAIAQNCPDKKLGLYMSLLDFDLWWDLRRIVREEKQFGDIVELNIRLGHTGGFVWSKGESNLWRFSKEKTGGGAFVMLGVHYLHLMRWLTGLMIKRVCAQAPNLHCPRIEGEDICVVLGELSNGGLFIISTAWNSHGEHFMLYGTEGSFQYLDNDTIRIRDGAEWKTRNFHYKPSGAWQMFNPVIPPSLDNAGNSFNQHLQFAEAIRNAEAPAVDVQDGLIDMRVVDAVYRSAASGNWEGVSDE